MDYQIRHFHNSQFQEYLEFIKSFPGKSYKEDKFVSDQQWQDHEREDRYIFFAFNDDEIAARCSISERKLNFEGDAIKCFEIGGTDTLPAHQRKGLFSRLVNSATDLGLSLQAKLIYGTPNGRSGPGYKKLGYSFNDISDSHLIFFPRVNRVVLKNRGLFRDQQIRNIRHEDPLISRIKGFSTNEITLDEYIKFTKDFPRMNFCDEEYLLNRLGNIDALNRRFFKLEKGGHVFYFALRNYQLQYLRTVLVSEYFIDGKRDDTDQKFQILKWIGSKYYRDHDGIYMKSMTKMGCGGFADKLKHRYFVHRMLPVCYNSQLPCNEIHKVMNRMINYFQMTDCDIG